MRQERNRLLTVGLLIIITLVLIGIGNRSGVLRPLTSAVMVPLGPLARLMTGGAETTAALGEEPEDVDALQERVRELERTVAELQVEIVRQREIEQDYFRLSELLDYAVDNPDQNLVTADVIARDTSSYLRWVIINRGARDGIRVGAPVINERGLVGRVEDVAANAAWVLLIIDPTSAVNARLQNARAEGTVTGQLQGGLRMELIPQETLLEMGDLVLTSGLGGRFPANIVIGQVSSVRSQQAALFQEAEVRPTVDFEHLELVSVITSFEPVDPSIFDEVIEERSSEEP
jgi:rod shape-determining protein MreC